MRQSGLLWKQVLMVLLHILHQTIFENLAMEMSIGCPWACGFFPLVVPSKADPAIAIVAIEGCLAIVTGFLIRPCDIVYAVGNLKHVPIYCFPLLLVRKKVEWNLDHFEVIDVMDSTHKSQEASFDYAWSILRLRQVLPWGVCKKQIQELAVVWLCRNTIGPAIWRHWSASHCGCWRMIPHKWEMISHNSKPRGYLAAGEWSHTNGKWSHKQATRQKRWVGWILNEIIMVINSFHWYFAES